MHHLFPVHRAQAGGDLPDNPPHAVQVWPRVVGDPLFEGFALHILHRDIQILARPGLDRLTVKFFPGNYVSTFTVIDFDMVEQARPGTVPVLLKPVLNGKKEVWIDVRVNAAGGVGTFSVEKAYFQSIRLPAFAVEKMINVVGSRQREKYDTSKPVPLPFGLRSIVFGDKTMSGEN